MEIKILSPEELEFKEKDIQRAFERDLTKLEEGLEFVDTEVTLGTGRVDTLAYDADNNKPVFIEYKGQGEFGKDALIQLMDYLSWFVRDENHMAVLQKAMRKCKADIGELEPDIRLICVVTDIEDRVRNAIYAIGNHVKVYSYMVARDTAGNAILVPKLELDNGEVEAPIPGPGNEEDILKRHPHLRDLFEALKLHLLKEDAHFYPTRRSFRFRRERIFAKLSFRKKHILLELRVGQGKVADPDFKYWRHGESNWGYVKLPPGEDIPPKVLDWIDLAIASANEAEDNEDEPQQD